MITFSLFFASRPAEHQPVQNEERRRLIEQLREREAEVAALSAARGAEAERTRIAREMHDTLAQGFASIVTLGHAVQGELDRDPAGARRHVEPDHRDRPGESCGVAADHRRPRPPGQLDGASLADAIARTVDSLAGRGPQGSGQPSRSPVRRSAPRPVPRWSRCGWSRRVWRTSASTPAAGPPR